jgi:hypothetical protein
MWKSIRDCLNDFLINLLATLVLTANRQKKQLKQASCRHRPWACQESKFLKIDFELRNVYLRMRASLCPLGCMCVLVTGVRCCDCVKLLWRKKRRTRFYFGCEKSKQNALCESLQNPWSPKGHLWSLLLLISYKSVRIRELNTKMADLEESSLDLKSIGSLR